MPHRTFWVILALIASPAFAADHFLTIGGGYSPSGNQVSLEKNVLFFRQVLADLYPNQSLPHDVFFSDGNSPGRDVQYDDPKWKVPEVNRLLARLSDEEDDLGFRYRSHEIPNIRGPATREEIEKWFAESGSKLASSDRLILYVTGHGSHDEDDAGTARYDNNFIELWNGDTLAVRDLATMLDKLPAGVSVVVIMVQCYSGGFADLLFTSGESDKGVAKNIRCGFFATMPDRTAAGCTPDVNEANYEDYSSEFWAALRGKTRTGDKIDRALCDFDSDGKVTFAEAHAYVLLTDDSIDVPMTTSDRFLRLHSDPGSGRGRLVSASDMIARLNSLASPADRAVIDGLSKQLQLGGQYRYDAAKELAETLKAQHKASEQEQKQLQDKFDDARGAIQDALELRWPELVNRWDPGVDRLLREEGDALIAAAKADSNYEAFTTSYEELEKLAERDDALETKWAKCHRLMRAIERVALAHNLDKTADEEIVAQYKSLISAENGTLGK
jgi:hypothetical protein